MAEAPTTPPIIKETTPPSLSPKPKEEPTTLYTRRDFFVLAGWGALAAALGAWLLSFVRFLFPRVLYEPPTTFKAGHPEEYQPNTVSSKWIRDQRVWIVRTDNTIYAMYARCTHLGCTPIWFEAENKVKCPCHGSGFTREGINYEGPAPRALDRLKITLAEDGQLEVDRNVMYQLEKGGWDHPKSFVKV